MLAREGVCSFNSIALTSCWVAVCVVSTSFSDGSVAVGAFGIMASVLCTSVEYLGSVSGRRAIPCLDLKGLVKCSQPLMFHLMHYCIVTVFHSEGSVC